MTDEIRTYWDEVSDPQVFPDWCDGGEPGSPERPSIWLFGIEPGNSRVDQAHENSGKILPGEESYSVDFQLARGWIFNRNAFKLLTVLNGEPLDAHVDFAQRERIFENGQPGYLKGNLFLEQFSDLATWSDEAAARTGCASKEQYYSQMREARFSIMHTWVEKCRPKLIIGCGLKNRDDFLKMAGVTELPERHDWIGKNGLRKGLYLTEAGVVPLAIIPHLSGQGQYVLRHDDDGIVYAANHIRAALGW